MGVNYITFFQEETSILTQMLAAVQEWVGTKDKDVQVLSVEPIEEEKTPATRVWLSAVGMMNFDHILLYHKNEVRNKLHIHKE